MKKRITCLLAVLIVLVSTLPMAFAYNAPSGAYSYQLLFTGSPTGTNYLLTFEREPTLKIAKTASSSWCFQTFDRYNFYYDYNSSGGAYDFYSYLLNNDVGNNTIYPGGLLDLVSSNFDLKFEDGTIYHAAEKEPEYNLENDWLSQTTECGAYIIAPKSGKVWTSNDTKVNITVQYRIPSVDLGGGGSLGVNALWYGVNSGGLPQGIAEWFTGPLDELSHDQKLEYDSGGIPRYMTGTVVFSGTMRKNMSMECYATVNGTEFESGGEIYETNHITMTHYDNFIDEDGDGKDDRDPDPDYNPGGTTDDNTDINGFGSILETLQAMKSTMNGVISFIGNYFRFIPSSIFALLGLGIGLVILLRVWGR